MSAFAIPDFALVCLIGPSGAGKSSLATRLFADTEIVSSDRCRALVADDETALDANDDAFELVRATASIRLRRRRLTVIDATSVRREDRASLVALARSFHALPVALVLDLDPAICHERNLVRGTRAFGARTVHRQSQALRKGLRGLAKEGFRAQRVLRTPEDVAALEIVREPLYTDRRDAQGPFDIVGDVHGCFEELVELLESLGYAFEPYRAFGGGAEADAGEEAPIVARHPEGRQAVFVGDVADRGPRNVDCWRTVMGMCAAGSARAVIGNHDYKLNRWLRGAKVSLAHGLDLTVAELERATPAFRERLSAFVYDLRSHLWLDGGRLVVAHAGLKAEMHGRGSAAVRSFAMYGETTGETDEFGLPVRLDWAREYRGEAAVVYGHVPTPDAEWLGDTLCVDTGCVYGHRLTALRWPERELVSVAARAQHAVPAKPLEEVRSGRARADHERLLYFDDYARKLRVETRIGGRAVTVPRENMLAALEAASRHATDPRWLIHLPPTMAAPPTAPEGPCLEHPDRALAFYARRGATDLVVEEKHMGSRAIVIACRDAAAAAARFGTDDGRAGVVLSRRGRAFFDDAATEAALVARVRAAMDAAGLWTELATDWVVLDAELMPWSAKAQGLIDTQYLPTAAGAEASAEALLASLDAALLPGGDEALVTLRADALRRRDAARSMRRTIAGYSAEVRGVEDYRLAPFHVLAAEGATFADRDHVWHMDTIARLAAHDPVLRPTGWRRVDARDPAQVAAVAEWWTAHTEAGGEGLVVKPAGFTVSGPKGLLPPAVKVRGREYLRLIYGPDYDLPGNLERLRERDTARKAALAEREFRLGQEGLARFVERRPLREVHECALAVLALESEPVDPRL